MPEITALPARKDNYIWLIRQHGEAGVVVVDPGEALPIHRAVRSESLVPAAILITHHHYDHVEGVAELVERYATPVYGPAGESIPLLTHPLREGDRVELAAVGICFQVLDIPGHTAGHIGYYGHGSLFCGDTLFGAGCGGIFDGTAQQLFHSLRKIAALPASTLIYCAHEYTVQNLGFAATVEPHNHAITQRRERAVRLRAKGGPTVPSTLAEEQRTNPFLRCREPDVIDAASRFAGCRLDSAEEVFVVLRHWKDSLDRQQPG